MADHHLRIPGFLGLMQYGDGVNADARFCTECENASSAEGSLGPVADCEHLGGDLPDPIETLARLHRRYHTTDQERDVLIAAAGGQLYWRLPAGEKWQRIPLPAELTAEEYQCSRFSCVSYEINPEGSSAPVDVLIMSNAKDGMLIVRGDDLTVTPVETPKKFGVIARHAERIWGGGIEGEPDMLAYCAPYDPFDWQQNETYPEDGAGDVLQPSWDGDSFTALASFGSQLMAFKRTRVWRVLGTNPGEYTFREQYGGGAPYPGTVAVDGTRILMLGRDGVYAYDGESVSPFQQAFARDVFARMNTSALEKAVACMWRGSYYCALPLDNSRVNNAVLIYSVADNTWTLRTDVQVRAFLPCEDALYFTSAPGKLWRWRDEADHCPAMRWVGPWQDLNLKHTVKSGFTAYVTVVCAAPVTLRLCVETEKKCVTKTVAFTPGARQRRIALPGSGRRFRFVVESPSGAPWRIEGGVQLEMEVDED